MTWSTNFTHPLAVGTFVNAEIAPCATCAKIRSYIPGVTQLKPVIFQDEIVLVFNRADKTYYKLKQGKMVTANDIKFVRV